MKNLIAVLALAFFVSCSSNSSNTSVQNSAPNTASNSNTVAADHNTMGHGSASDHSSMASSPGAASAPVELQFIDTMIAHHQGAVDMANLAAPRAQHQELKDLAADIIDAQEREMARMSEMRDKWFAEKSKAINMEFPGMSHGMGQMDLKKLEALKGNEFDLEFLRQMIPHHEGAIDMAKEIQKQDSRTELKTLAGDIIRAQEQEIKQMRGWLNAWQTKN